MDRKYNELESAPFYLVSNWNKIMPKDISLVDMHTKEMITPENFSRYHESMWLTLKDRRVANINWGKVDLTPREIRALNSLDFEELRELSFKFDLGAIINTSTGFLVLPKDIVYSKGLYNFGAEIIDSYFGSELPNVFESKYEHYRRESEGCALVNFNIEVKGMPSTKEEIHKLGQFVGKISSLRDILVPELEKYVSEEKKFQKEIRKCFSKKFSDIKLDE